MYAKSVLKIHFCSRYVNCAPRAVIPSLRKRWTRITDIVELRRRPLMLIDPWSLELVSIGSSIISEHAEFENLDSLYRLVCTCYTLRIA